MIPNKKLKCFTPNIAECQEKVTGSLTGQLLEDLATSLVDQAEEFTALVFLHFWSVASNMV